MRTTEASAWDASQQAVLDEAEQRHADPLLVYGPPGSGKSALAVELTLRNLQDGHDSARTLLLSPTRQSADRLRESVEHGIALAGAQGHTLSVSEQPAKSFASYAFWLLGEARRLKIAGTEVRPRLLSGAEQDRIIGNLVQQRQQEAEDPGSCWHQLKEAFSAEKGLRRELREFLDRCNEYSIGPGQLRELAAGPGGRRIWAALADLAEDYTRVLAEHYPGAYDPAALITRACDLLEAPLPDSARPDQQNHEPEYFWQRERQRLNRVIVDDVQEASPSVYRLLRLIGTDQHLIAFASPDTAVQGFRGARPDKLSNWEKPIRPPGGPDAVGSMASIDTRSRSRPRTLSLQASYRISGEAAELYRRITERIGVVTTLLRSISPAPAASDQPQTGLAIDTGHSGGECSGKDQTTVTATTVATSHLAEQLVLQKVLEAHHLQKVPWHQIAVIVRSGAEMRSIARTLDTYGVAVARSISDTVLHQEPAVTPLLDLLAAAADENDAAALSYPDVVALLTSPYGAIDAVQLRNLHQKLLSLDRALEDEAPSLPQPDALTELSRAELLLLHAVITPGTAEALKATAEDQPENLAWAYRPLDRLRRMVRAARSAIAQEDLAGKPEQALWKVWDAAEVSDWWQRMALGEDLAARQANRNLDAVIALFQTAERFVGQNTRVSVEDFIDYIASLELPMDSIADTGSQDGAVEVLTPSAAAGREFDAVIISGLQEGSWPNLQPRGELLGSTDLVSLRETGPESITTDLRAKRAQVLQDEYRLFAAAASRATRHLSLVAVEAEDSTPSSLFDLVAPAETTTAEGKKVGRTVLTRVPRPIEGAALAAELRGVLERGAVPGPGGARTAGQEDLEAAAALLRQLAEAGVPGADPENWWGYRRPTSAGEPITDPERPLSVNPSSVDTAISNPLQWFTGAAGGTAPSSPEQSLGTFVHKIAEDHPHADLDTLYAVLEQRWSQFRSGASWANDLEKTRAQAILRHLGLYYAESQAKGRALIGTEIFLNAQGDFTLDDGSPRTAVIYGKADRIEWAPADPAAGTPAGFYIVDFKTGRNVPSDQEVSENYPQIDIYQWAALEGAVTAALRRLLTTDAAELGERQRQEKLNLEDIFAASGIRWNPEDETLSFELQGQLVSIALASTAEQQVAGAALVQLGTKNKGLKVQNAGQAAAQRAPEQIAAAASVMAGSTFTARHEPGATSCYAGLLCPLCSAGRQVSEP